MLSIFHYAIKNQIFLSNITSNRTNESSDCKTKFHKIKSASSLKLYPLRELRLKHQLHIVRKERERKKTTKKTKYRSVVPGNLKCHHDFARSLVAAKYAHKY